MSSRPIERLTAADALALVLIVAAFSWIAFRNIRQPGLQGDEAWMGVSAARLVWGSAPAGIYKVTVFGHVLPTMVKQVGVHRDGRPRIDGEGP